MNNKISVITVVRNDAMHIRETLESFFSQTWEDKEYIVIDGASTDGTTNIIREYSDKIDYFVSEPDNGLYDALNKALSHCNGYWINVLNSGDRYASQNTLEDTVKAIMELYNESGDGIPDVIFGNSIELHDVFESNIYADPDIAKLEFAPTFRHGSSFIKASVHKSHPFAIEKRKRLKYALDWEMLYRLYKEGYKFAKIDVTIESYRIEGMSNHPYLNHILNYKVTSQGHFSGKKLVHCAKSIINTFRVNSSLGLYLSAFILEYLPNSICPHIPFWSIRKPLLKLAKVKLGNGSFIMRKCYFMDPNRLVVGEHSHINRGCIIDARGTITIGNNVSVSHNVQLISGGHDAQSPKFMGVFKPIKIDDYAWLGVGCTILQGVHIGKGAVVAAGSVVTKDVEPFAVVGGIPARKIGERNQNLNYECHGWKPFT